MKKKLDAVLDLVKKTMKTNGSKPKTNSKPKITKRWWGERGEGDIRKN